MAVSNTSPNVDNYYSGKGIVKWSTDGMTWKDVGNVPTFEFNPQVARLEHYSARTGIRFKDKSVVTTRQAQIRMVMEEWTADNLAMALLGLENVAVSLVGTATFASSTAVTSITPTTNLVVGEQYLASGPDVPAGAILTYNGSGAGTLSVAATGSGSLAALTLTRPIEIDIMSQTEVQGSLRFIGTNIVGPLMQVDLPSVTLAPSAMLALIHGADEWGPIEVNGEVTWNPTLGAFGQWYWNIAGEMAFNLSALQDF